MRYGLLLTTDVTTPQSVQEYVDLNVQAEASGFVSSFLVEHHFSGWNQVSAPLMVQACVARSTSTLRIGTGVTVVPWHNPVLLAEQVATLDVLSDGRVDLGIGKGYRQPEFDGFGVAPGEADERFAEGVAVLVAAWINRQGFSHCGRFWRFDDVVVEPAPVQQPHPPLWVAAASEASIRRAAASGFNLVLDQYASVEEIRGRIAQFGTGEVAVARQVYVATSRAEAEEALRVQARFTKRTIDASRTSTSAGGSHVLRYCNTEEHALFGTPDEVLAGLDELAAIGVDYVLVNPAGHSTQIERFARHVLGTT